MGLFKNRAVTGSCLGSVLGLLAGSSLGALIALGAVMIFIPEPEPGYGFDPIAAGLSLLDAVVRAFWVLTGWIAGGIAGAIAGGIFGAARASRSTLPAGGAPPTSTPDEEIAILKQRIAELESSRSSDGSL
jgi:hypothetical protein